MKRSFYIILLCLVGTSLCLSCSSETIVSTDDIPQVPWTAKADQYLDGLVQTNDFSGSVLIGKEGNVLFSKGYAMANREHEILNMPKTKFRLGSLTKQFTAMVILILQEQDKLHVDESVCMYIPDCPTAWRPITLHHLLTHTSGIPNLTSFEDNLQHERLPTTIEKTVERFRHKALEFIPGERFKYSNSGYVLLGYIIEQITGQSYEDIVDQLIFTPLNMHSSGYDHPRTILKHRASGYSRQNNHLLNAIHFEMDTPHAAGGLYSTTEDLLKWDQALYNNTLVSNASMTAMFTPFKGDYAYGWFIGRISNRRTAEHGGGISGFRSHILRFPDERLCIIVLSNYEFADARDIAHQLASIMEIAKENAMPK